MTFSLYTKSLLAIACAGFITTGCSNMSAKSDKSDNNTSSESATSAANSLESKDIIIGESDPDVIANLNKNLSKSGAEATHILSAKPTYIEGMYWVVSEDTPPFFTDKAGEHIFQGQVIKISNGEAIDISTKLNETVIQERLAAVPEKDMIIYPAKGETKSKVFVFTDSTCPYCQKLHDDIDELNSKGIEVRYLAWPRNQRAAPILEAVWCSKDRVKAMNDTKAGRAVASKSCDSPVKGQTALGFAIGVRGTPAIYSEAGEQLGGYIPPEGMVKALGL